MRISPERLAVSIIDGLAPTFDSLHKRVQTIENSPDAIVVDPIDFDRQYPNGTFGVHRNGLWLYRIETASWHCISRSVWDLRMVKERNGTTSFEVELSDGTILNRVVTKVEPTKAVKLQKASTKPVKLINKPVKPVSIVEA